MAASKDTRENNVETVRADSLDSDDFKDPKKGRKKESRRQPTVEDGNQWFKGPIDNNESSKLKRLMRNMKPGFLQRKSVTPPEIKMNKVVCACSTDFI